jgi:hypothetical protein
MLPNDVFRERLEQTLVELEAWAKGKRDCADIEIAASERYWKMAIVPHFSRACAFELLIEADQTFGLVLQDEVYEKRPIERFDLFPKLVTAIAAGRVERIETRNALTGVLLAVAMRVELADGWDWIGSRYLPVRSLSALKADEERRTYRFLPYNR